MKLKTLISVVTALTITIFGISYSFAANNNIASDAAQGIRNIVGGAENVIENTAGGLTNGMRNGMATMDNTIDNGMTTMDNSTKNDTDYTASGSMTTDNNNYTATRTATTRTAATGNDTFLGMGATAWTWLVMSIVGITTIALVWYYGKERENNYNRNDNY